MRDEDRALLDALDFHKNVRSALLAEMAADQSDPVAAAAAAAAITASERSRGAAENAAQRALLAQKELIWFQQALQRQPPADADWSPGHRVPPRPQTAQRAERRLERRHQEQELQARQRRVEELRLLRRRQQQQRMWDRTAAASQPCLVGSDLKHTPPRLHVVKLGASTPERLVPELVLRRARSLQQLDLPSKARPSTGDALSRRLDYIESRPAAVSACSLPATTNASAVQARRLHSRVSMYLSLR